MSRAGADLAQLLLGAFRTLADRATAELIARGYQEVRPVHDFALQAILSGADTTSEVGRRMHVSKQAAAKTISALEQSNYVAREPDPADRRRQRLYVTANGLAMLSEAEAIFDELRGEWERQVGAAPLAQMEGMLSALLGKDPTQVDIQVDAAKWMAPEASSLGH
ncbi:MarR family winged helix-turn-helix transcriptional regulator [Amycolatopsis sp. NBC_01480]|uniref:MarR family winged helix-turn-helix transcriptional regulator n=1 Tax=Amycolatopsis sp. NBC_01480 TaxID=2903562 RepID=UPI002E2B6740|nr:MarR family transcriptional regulator [Amycolatopsis sp. NBC_01480]